EGSTSCLPPTERPVRRAVLCTKLRRVKLCFSLRGSFELSLDIQSLPACREPVPCVRRATSNGTLSVHHPCNFDLSSLPARNDVRAEIEGEGVVSLRVAAVLRPEFKFQLFRGGGHVQVPV